MRFEVGKYYKHRDGTYFAIRAEADTTMWGRVFVVETPNDVVGLRPVEIDNRLTEGFAQISEREWLNLFKKTEKDGL